jgi:hypothetical protein
MAKLLFHSVPNYFSMDIPLLHHKNRMTRILQHGHNIVTWSYLYSMVKLLQHGQTIAIYNQNIEACTNYCSMDIMLLHGKTLASLPYHCCMSIILFQHGQTIAAYTYHFCTTKKQNDQDIATRP